MDASLATLCRGDPVRLALVHERLVIGSRVGEIDPAAPRSPLQADLERHQRRLRLMPEAQPRRLALDLRTAEGMARSELLHRLDLLGIDWGRLEDGRTGRGTFRERWTLEWRPALSVRLGEASVHGIDIDSAAASRAADEARAATTIDALSALVRRCLLANLPGAMRASLARMQAAAVDSDDVPALMRAVPPLVDVLRYGTARAVPREELAALVRLLCVGVVVGTPLACRRLDEAAARALAPALSAFDVSLGTLDEPHLARRWDGALLDVVRDEGAAPLVRGCCARRLHDRAGSDPESTARRLSRALSRASGIDAAGLWLEGFLDNTAEVLLHDRPLLKLIDAWLCALCEADFIAVLPMLRRALGELDALQCRHLLGRVASDAPGTVPARALRSDGVDAAATTVDTDGAAFAQALPMLDLVLGRGTAPPDAPDPDA